MSTVSERSGLEAAVVRRSAAAQPYFRVTAARVDE